MYNTMVYKYIYDYICVCVFYFNLTPNVHHTLQFIASGTKTCGFSAHCKIKWRAASANFFTQGT